MCTADSAHEFLWWALKPCSSAFFCCVEELLSFCFLTEYDLHMMLDTRVKADDYENPKMAAFLRASTPVGPRDCTALAAKGQHPHGSKGLHCPGSQGPAPLWVQGTPLPWQSRDSTPVGRKGLHCLGSRKTSASVWVPKMAALAVKGQHPCESKGLHCIGSQRTSASVWVPIGKTAAEYCVSLAILFTAVSVGM